MKKIISTFMLTTTLLCACSGLIETPTTPTSPAPEINIDAKTKMFLDEHGWCKAQVTIINNSDVSAKVEGGLHVLLYDINKNQVADPIFIDLLSDLGPRKSYQPTQNFVANGREGKKICNAVKSFEYKFDGSIK